MAGRERLRLFCALRLSEETLDRLVCWQRDAFEGVHDVRVVGRAHLHVTLAFLGSRPLDELPAVVEALRGACSAAQPPRLETIRYRETRSVGMAVLSDENDRASALAEDLHDRLERLGVYERERRPWLPHVTVVRFRRPPRLRLDPPALGALSPSEAAVYHSVLRPGGAQYDILESVALGG